MIKERPIIFSGLMVRAILEGRKSQTRRMKGLELLNEQPDRWRREGDIFAFDGGFEYLAVPKCPYGVPGDRLWVRESFFIPDAPYKAKNSHLVSYKADETNQPALQYTGWRPSIHMPRWASRITLEIVTIRVERVQKISETDAVAEGIEPDGPVNWDDLTSCWRNYDPHETAAYWNSPRDSFHSLWSAINGADSWVWVLDFKRVA